MPPRTPEISPSIVRRPTAFKVGTHTVVVALGPTSRWTAACDDVVVDGHFDSEADAWAAGVREAERLDAGRGDPW